MDQLFAFLNQPIVLTITTLTFGGYLVNTIAHRRARNDKRREKAIDFLTDTASALNEMISSLNGSVRSGKQYTHEDAMGGLVKLYSRRMNVKLASDAYLRSDSFPLQYDQLLEELSAVALLVPSLGQGAVTATSINEKRTRLRDAWPVTDEPSRPASDTPQGEVMLWLDMILDRVTAMLSSSLTAVMS